MMSHFKSQKTEALKLNQDDQGLLISNISDRNPVYLKDEGKTIHLKNFPWIDLILSGIRDDNFYKIFFRVSNGTYRYWQFSLDGDKVDQKDILESDLDKIIENNLFEICIQPINGQAKNANRLRELSDLLKLRAKKLIAEGHHSKAQKLYERLVLLDASDLQIIQELAICLSVQKKFSEATQAYLFLAAMQPTFEINVWHFQHKIITYIRKTNDISLLDRTIHSFEQISVLLKKRALTLNLLGELCWLRGRIKYSIRLKKLAANENVLGGNKTMISLHDSIAEISDQKHKDPDFLVLGPQKSGTTALYRYVTDHPKIYASSSKEIFFFDLKYNNGLTWYRSHFPVLSQKTYLTGEATATYFNSIEAAQRISEHYPNIKLIFILRNPVERAISDYYMKLRDGLESRDMATAFREEISYVKTAGSDLLKPDRDFRMKHKGYIRNSIYYPFIKYYMEIFDKDNIKIVFSKDLRKCPDQEMEKVFDFLGLEYSKGRYPLINTGNYKTGDKELQMKEELRSFFKPYNSKLQMFLNLSIDWND